MPSKSELQLYHEYIQKRIRRLWKPSPGARPVHVAFVVEIDGSVRDARIVESSGDTALDRSALAFVESQRLKPLPDLLAQRLGHLAIDYLF
jgi:TonB family protein